MQFVGRATLLVTAFLLLGNTVSREPRPPKSIPVPKVCVQPADKNGKPKRDKPDVRTQPYCPNPDVASTPTPSKRRRIER